ncbi:hypothetical protein AKJ16_DCAP25618 [Drosera capensis]
MGDFKEEEVNEEKGLEGKRVVARECWIAIWWMSLWMCGTSATVARRIRAKRMCGGAVVVEGIRSGLGSGVGVGGGGGGGGGAAAAIDEEEGGVLGALCRAI